MRLVIALGGNALLRRGEPLTAAAQLDNIRVAVAAIAPLARHHSIVLTHGNGPQVGLLALQAEAYKSVPPYPLDVLGAETEGMIGYLLEQELTNLLPEQSVVTLLTQVTVDAADPAFQQPTKFIGPVYSQVEAQRLAADRGWAIAPDGAGYRRVVPSPEPRRIIELPAIRLLLEAGVLVICTGGGGIPVVVSAAGSLHGVEAVIDKDRAAALLAQTLNADGLLLLTDVPAVQHHWGTDQAENLGLITASELRQYSFAPGSMGPKVEAACRFVEATGGWAGIGALTDAAGIMAGDRGTRITR